MPIYSPEALNDNHHDHCHHGDIVDHEVGMRCVFPPLGSSIGMGPRGHSINVNVIGDRNGSRYRIQFIDSVTRKVLETTPNLAPGTRIYVCRRVFEFSEGGTYVAGMSDFPPSSPSALEDIRVGDLIVFMASRAAEGDVLGIGIVASIDSEITFDVYTYVYSSGEVPDGSITTAKLADLSVTPEKISPLVSLTNLEIDNILNL